MRNYILLFGVVVASFSWVVNASKIRGHDRKQINQYIDGYVKYLEGFQNESGGATLNKVLKTKKYRYIKDKLAQLASIRRKVKHDELEPGELLVMIVDDLKPVKDNYYKDFSMELRKLLVKLIRAEQQSEQRDQEKNTETTSERTCCICLEDIKGAPMVFNCGHANICSTCNKAGKFKKCPSCRAELTHICHESTCVLCGKEPGTTLHAQCAHLDTCSSCLENRKGDACLICGKESPVVSLKLFY